MKKLFLLAPVVALFCACAPTEQMAITGAAKGNALAAADFMGAIAGLSALNFAQNGEFGAANAMLAAAAPLAAAPSPRASAPAASYPRQSSSTVLLSGTGYCENPYGGARARAGFAPSYSDAQFICTPEGFMRACICDNSGCGLDPQPWGSNKGCSAPGRVYD